MKRSPGASANSALSGVEGRTLVLLLCALAACDTAPSGALRPPHPVGQAIDELRPTDTSSGLMWRYLATDVVESFGVDGGGFRVHFTRAGVNAVPTGDADDSGVPDFVEAVDSVYEEVGRKYVSMGFRKPLGDESVSPNGGDGRFDVYLLDFARAADGAFRIDTCLAANAERCVGYVVQENDFVGYGYPNTTVATRILGSHEFFHAVQAAYDDGQNVVLSEGTAVWATEEFDPTTSDFENFIDGYLDRPERSIDSPPPGPVPSFAYGSAIFFRFLSEKYGADVIRKLWEKLENGQGDPSEPSNAADPTFVVQLDALLKRDYQSSFAAAFREFATWNLYMGLASDSTKAWRASTAYPSPLTTTVQAPYWLDAMRVYYASAQYYRLAPGNRASMTAALVDNPATADDELDGLALVIASRRAGRNVEVKDVAQPQAAAESVDTTNNAELIVAVINTARGANGAILSKRPGLCIGTKDEVDACRLALNPSLDAGVPDAGEADAGNELDAGLQGDAGTDATPPKGCGCGMPGGSPWLLALALIVAALRRAR